MLLESCILSSYFISTFSDCSEASILDPLWSDTVSYSGHGHLHLTVSGEQYNNFLNNHKKWLPETFLLINNRFIHFFHSLLQSLFTSVYCRKLQIQSAYLWNLLLSNLGLSWLRKCSHIIFKAMLVETPIIGAMKKGARGALAPQ